MRTIDAQVIEVLAAHNPSVYDEATNEDLWERIPPDMRLVHYTRQAIPADHYSAFGYYHSKIGDIHLDGLPIEMQREVAFAIWRIVEIGGTVPCAPMGLLTRELAETTARLRKRGKEHRTLMARTPLAWRRELTLTWVARTGRMPGRETLRTYLQPLDRVYKLLWFAYDAGPWWRREIWDPQLDARIPRRAHEPRGPSSIHWYRIGPHWLRLAAMWHVKVGMETNELCWSTAHQRYTGMLHFAAFLSRHAIDSPDLVGDHSQLRPLMMGFLDDLRSRPVEFGRRAGERRSQPNIATITAAVRSLYAFMHDRREEAAHILGDSRWERLGPEHLRFWLDGDFPRRRSRKPFDERHLISDETRTKVLAHVHHLGEPRSAGGFGDPQAMRLLILLILTGRRVSELLMLDPNPLLPVSLNSGPDGRDQEPVAKLRYQQTKIEGAPDTIFVGHEVIEVIAEQQRWLAELRRKKRATGGPRYLFTKQQNSIPGERPYTYGRLQQQLSRLATRFDLRDDTGELIKLAQTHRWRHTKATSLINAGVPLHVVQRYMGHTTPEMTMHYAQTLDATAKAEFLRYQKITREGRLSGASASDLYDLMALETRTDRVLPNGWCTLPPAQSCDKGNACLTCNLFVTDQRFRGVHEQQLHDLEALVTRRQRDHRARTGEDMSERHVWLEQRRKEQAALRGILAALPGDETAVHGVGAAARVGIDQKKGGIAGT